MRQLREGAIARAAHATVGAIRFLLMHRAGRRVARRHGTVRLLRHLVALRRFVRVRAMGRAAVAGHERRQEGRLAQEPGHRPRTKVPAEAFHEQEPAYRTRADSDTVGTFLDTMPVKRLLLALLAVIWVASSASAQTPNPSAARPWAVLEAAGGYAGFVDDATIDHGLIGGAMRWFLSPRISVGPELVYMVGPGSDRDLMLTGNLTIDFMSPESGRPAAFTPFIVVGGGLFRHSQRFGAEAFASIDPSFTAGAGARARVSDRVAVGADFRIGWELHCRVAGVVAVSLGRR